MKLTDRRDELDRPVYLWTIGQDEQDRLSALLEADFYDTGVAGTYVTAPPQVCPHCGKETEFIDWSVHCLVQPLRVLPYVLVAR